MSFPHPKTLFSFAQTNSPAYYAKTLDGFDAKAFFEGRAKMEPVLRTALYELQCIYGADAHPSAYLNVNVALQQLDEFYDAYGVKESDDMYLAPDERLVLW